jgi:rare lipoprotein A
MQIKLFLLTVLFCLPAILEAGNKKVSKNVWQGTASYYHNMFEGRKTANGEIFRQKKLTGANNFLPLGTMVKVTNLKNGKSVVVKINDRMAKRLTHRRLIDLSREAARRLGYLNAGLASVRMEVLSKNYKKRKKN